MAEGIRATVAFSAPGPCTIADVAGELDTIVDSVWRSVPPDGSVPPVSEFSVENDERPEVAAADHLLSIGDRHLFRMQHGEGITCPCECLGSLGVAARRYVARPGSLEIVFDATDYEELQTVVGVLRERFPEVDVQRLVRAPHPDRDTDEVFVDRGKLTDRQLEVLQTAYRMGYFARPRLANATEVAAELGVDPSTFAEHLAAAQSKLFGDLLGEDPPRGT